MQPHQYTILDVFAERKYGGNQLAVVEDAQDLSSQKMQLIAREMNFAETTFILSKEQRKGGYDVRIFTTSKELPFAGHPSLGTAFVIQQDIVARKVRQVILNLKYGPVPVEFDYQNGKPSTLWLNVKNPRFGKLVSPRTIAGLMGIDRNDVDGRFPPQVVSIGIPFVIAPLRTLKALKRVRPSVDEFDKAGIREILLFCPESRDPDNDLAVRFFSRTYDIHEDSATGSANAGLAAYLVKHRYFGKSKIDVRVEQGH